MRCNHFFSKELLANDIITKLIGWYLLGQYSIKAMTRKINWKYELF